MAPQLGHDQAPKMSTESDSSLFPNRPIRPLPKRRLRERLSPEVADSIQYPPLPQSSTSLFSYPYPLAEEHFETSPAPVLEPRSNNEQRQPRSNGVGKDRDDENTPLRQVAIGSRPTRQHANLVARPKTEHGRYANSTSGPPASSAADGYDLFENTNNKKRKIPTAGDSAPGGAHTLGDLAAAMGPPGSGTQFAEGQGDSATSASAPYGASGGSQSNAHNVPGPGRGRYGRPRSGKSPLRPLYDSTNSWARRTSKQRPGQWPAETNESTGIISNAIANAEKLPLQQGQENISLLQQPSSVKRSPASTQFTFTCDSQVPGSLAWPGSDRRTAMANHQDKENWSRVSQPPPTGHTATAMPPAADAGTREAQSRGSVGGQNPHPAPPKTSRRSATKEYIAAARARRRETQLYNQRHPPKPEDIWICHFCEYEAIFGHPPEALVRAYEIKERKQRQVEEQRRAQWERMKKGKHKGKKNSKLPTKNGGAGVQDAHHHADGRAATGDHYDHGAQGEEYYDDEYYEDEEYEAEEEEVAYEHHGPEVPARHDHVHNHVPATFGGRSAVHDGGGT